MVVRSARARRKPRPIDWRRAAELLVENMPVGAVAREIGCSRSAISRRRNHDPIFQDWMQRLRSVHTSDPEERVAELRRSLHAAINEQIGKGNARIILWLAERLNLVPAFGERTPAEELRGLLGASTPTSCRNSRICAIRPEPDDHRSSGSPEGCTIRSRPS